jgi:hypothetical protein
MTLKELALLVQQMRSAQRTYFKDRTTQALEASKRVERELDAAVKEILDPKPLGLFDRLEDAE